MKKWIYLLLIGLFSNACKEKITPELIGVWQLTEVPGRSSDHRIGSRIEFKNNGIIHLGLMDCYCSLNNSYKVSGNKIYITIGQPQCYPIVDCPRPTKANIIQIDSEKLTVEWIFSSNYPETLQLNYQATYKRIQQ